MQYSPGWLLLAFLLGLQRRVLRYPLLQVLVRIGGLLSLATLLSWSISASEIDDEQTRELQVVRKWSGSNGPPDQRGISAIASRWNRGEPDYLWCAKGPGVRCTWYGRTESEEAAWFAEARHCISGDVLADGTATVLGCWDRGGTFTVVSLNASNELRIHLPRNVNPAISQCGGTAASVWAEPRGRADGSALVVWRPPGQPVVAAELDLTWKPLYHSWDLKCAENATLVAVFRTVRRLAYWRSDSPETLYRDFPLDHGRSESLIVNASGKQFILDRAETGGRQVLRWIELSELREELEGSVVDLSVEQKLFNLRAVGIGRLIAVTGWVRSERGDRMQALLLDPAAGEVSSPLDLGAAVTDQFRPHWLVRLDQRLFVTWPEHSTEGRDAFAVVELAVSEEAPPEDD